jgi:hypothetical protein
MLAALSYKAAVRSQEQVITVAQQHILNRQKAASRQHPQRADGAYSGRRNRRHFADVERHIRLAGLE